MITSYKVNWKKIYEVQFSNNIILKDEIEKKRMSCWMVKMKKQNNIELKKDKKMNWVNIGQPMIRVSPIGVTHGKQIEKKLRSLIKKILNLKIIKDEKTLRRIRIINRK
jgi:hypothetical protein